MASLSSEGEPLQIPGYVVITEGNHLVSTKFMFTPTQTLIYSKNNQSQEKPSVDHSQQKAQE